MTESEAFWEAACILSIGERRAQCRFSNWFYDRRKPPLFDHHKCE